MMTCFSQKNAVHVFYLNGPLPFHEDQNVDTEAIVGIIKNLRSSVNNETFQGKRRATLEGFRTKKEAAMEYAASRTKQITRFVYNL